MARLTNDTVELVPRVELARSSELRLDFPGLEIGTAEYDEGPTGCTVFHFAEGAALATDVRGGSPGTFGGDYQWVHAICLAGGSLYGLDASTGMAAELLARRGYATGWTEIAVVAGAIVFDYGARDNAIYPDKELGRAAFRAAREGSFPLGARGAGRSTTVGKLFDVEAIESAGQRAAFRRIGETCIAAFTVVNTIGAIVDRIGTVVRGHVDSATGQRRALVPALEQQLSADAPPGNTTLTVVVTNRTLDRRSLTQLGRQVHASMARAIQPFHALADGDVLFALSTEEIDDDSVSSDALGVVASELAWDAVLSSVRA